MRFVEVMKKHVSKKRRKARLSGGQFGKSHSLRATPSSLRLVEEDKGSPGPQGSDKDIDEYLARLIANEEAYLNPHQKGVDIRPILRKYAMLPEAIKDVEGWEVQRYLRFAVDMLARHHLCLTSTNHLTDRELLATILEKVLPEPIGIGPNPQGTLIYHDCCPCDSIEWYIHYGDESDRESYESNYGETLPDPIPLVSDRDKWIELLAESYRDEGFPTFPD